MSKLLAYLEGERISRKDFAERIGVHDSVVSRFCRDLARPSLETAVRIEAETGGAVPVASWVKQEGAAQ